MTQDKRKAVYVFHSEVWDLPESRKLVQLVGGRSDVRFEYARHKRGQKCPAWLGLVVPEHEPEKYEPSLCQSERSCDMVFHLKTLPDVCRHIEVIERAQRRFLEAFVRDPEKAMRGF